MYGPTCPITTPTLPFRRSTTRAPTSGETVCPPVSGVGAKESARAGEADLIVGKHRNGPTAIITTAFQGHYSRFVDMALT